MHTRALVVGFFTFWIGIYVACFVTARVFAPWALLGTVTGAFVVPMVISGLAVRRAIVGVRAGRKPVGAFIVLALVALWSIHGVGRHADFICRSLQTEAKQNLTSLYVSGSLAEPQRRYEYVGSGADAQAFGIGVMAGDEWQIVDGKPAPITSVCPLH